MCQSRPRAPWPSSAGCPMPPRSFYCFSRNFLPLRTVSGLWADGRIGFPSAMCGLDRRQSRVTVTRLAKINTGDNNRPGERDPSEALGAPRDLLRCDLEQSWFFGCRLIFCFVFFFFFCCCASTSRKEIALSQINRKTTLNRSPLPPCCGLGGVWICCVVPGQSKGGSNGHVALAVVILFLLGFLHP